MRRVLKWIGIVLGGLLGLLLIAVTVLAMTGGSKLNKQYEIKPQPVTISEETAVLERGEYLVSASCMGCHGDDLGGTAFFDEPAIGVIPAPNLTAGQGGAGAVYNNEDFVRAIRHGVDSEGKPLAIMPSRAYWHYSDEDLGAIIAYVKSVPSVDNDLGDKNIKLVGRLLIGAGMMDILGAESIDHASPLPEAQEPMVNATYGKYVANTADCHACHGPSLAGAQAPEPGAPYSPNLTPNGNMNQWTTEEFLIVMRTGQTPDGRQLDPAFMPWKDYGRLSDDDLTALFLHLQSLPTAVAAE